MDNNLFDSKLREKLQNFEPDYEERAWRNFAPQLRPTHPQNYLQYSKKIIAYMSVAAVLVALVIFGYNNYTLTQQKEELIAKNTKNQQEKELVEAPNHPVENAPLVDKKEAISPSTQASKVVEPAKKETIRSIEKISIAEHSGQKIESKSVVNPLKSVTNDNKTTQPLEIKNSNPVINAPTSNNQPPINQENIANTTPKSAQSIGQLNKTEIENKKETVNSVPTSIFKSIETIAQKELNFGLESKELNIPIQREPNNTDVLPNKFPKSWVGIGVSTTFQPFQSAKGFMINVSPTNRFSINIGAELAKQTRLSYSDEKDFKEDHDEDFGHVIGGGMQPNIKFSDIEYQRTQWELPISLQYRQPIFKGFSVVALAGSRIFLSAKERYKYQYEKSGGGDDDEGNDEFEKVAPKPREFNNRYPMFVGVGVQALIAKKVQIQFTPQLFLNAPKPVHNQHNFMPIAAQLSVMYRL